MSAPTVENQVWIATYSAELLQHIKLRKAINLMRQDIFQQVAIEKIYERESELPMPCEIREFVSKEEAMEWLLSDYQRSYLWHRFNYQKPLQPLFLCYMMQVISHRAFYVAKTYWHIFFI